MHASIIANHVSEMPMKRLPGFCLSAVAGIGCLAGSTMAAAPDTNLGDFYLQDQNTAKGIVTAEVIRRANH
jgi:hypothetical protein